MSMMLKGSVLRVAYKDEFIIRSSGEPIPHSSVLQVLSESQGRFVLQDLSLDGDQFETLRSLEGKEILCAVRTWVDRKTQQVRIFPEDDASPDVLGPALYSVQSRPSAVKSASAPASG